MGRKTSYFMGLVSGMALMVGVWVAFTPFIDMQLPTNNAAFSAPPAVTA